MGGANSAFVWHPSKRSIFFQKIEARHRVWEVTFQGGASQERPIFPKDELFFSRRPFFSFSPSGKEVAYCAIAGVYIANDDGTNRRKITPAGFNKPFQIDWAPDGRQLVFTAGVKPPHGVYIYSLDTGKLRTLTALDYLPSRPMWTNDALAINPSGKVATTWSALKQPPTR